MSRLKILLCLTVLSLLLLGVFSLSLQSFALTSTGTSIIKYPEGELRKTSWRDMLPHTIQGNYYNEFWIYHIFLENDLHLHLTFSLANFGTFKSAVSGGKLMVSNFNGNNYHVSREYPMDKFVIDHASQKIKLHPEREIYFEGNLPETHHVHFETSKNNVSYYVDIQFHDISPGFTWGSGLFQVDDHSTGIFMHIPKAQVAGLVAVNSDTLRVRGTAYMDHTFQTGLSSKVMQKGFRYISHAENGFSSGYYLIPKNNQSQSDVVGFGLSNESNQVRLNKPGRVTVEESGSIDGKSIPETIEIQYRSGELRTLRRTRNFQHVSFLEEVGGLRRRLVSSFLGGEIIEYVGKGELNGNGLTPVNYNFFIVH
ncbi:MAG: hypothetical protein WD097_08080 [Balneolales bacterium]